MPTLPLPEPASQQPATKRQAEQQHHAQQPARLATSFGTDAARYDRARPGYPEALTARLAQHGPRVLDVGCGTGVSSRPFLAAGCRVLGVEPDPRMAEPARGEGLEVEVAAFEDWDPAGRTFDTVIAGQAWHWVDPLAGAAKAAALLPPGGRLAAFWNVFQPPAELADAFAAVYRSVVPDLPPRLALPGLDGYAPLFARTADGIRSTGAFDEPEQWHHTWDRPYTRAEWLDQVPTFGGHARLPADTLAALLTGLGAAVDSAGGTFTMAYTTVTVTALRRHPAP